MSDEDDDVGGEFVLIAAYSRRQALEDGTLVDVTELAKQAGIKAPVALTRSVWEKYVELSPAAEKAGNDTTGRLWDVLWMFRCAALQQPDEAEIRYELHVVTDAIEPSLVELKAMFGPGDDGEAVITILLPEED
ncbi:DUF6573 family protein [Polyangium spumosum]|uniref:Uncharacterized protein n=1 Tax=Polyangium spumosum TaxID=889282 RepID=A0A6N7Q7Y2_9BACT|nr:hypothetical protein [Polyangium spumosum]